MEEATTAKTRQRQPAGVGDLAPLAEAKLAAPRERAGIVERPRILRALDAGEEASLTLLAAPPGYGKTTAVRAWCAKQHAPLAWVTLDADDNDPARLWTYVATAVDRIREGLGRTALQRLRVLRPPVEVPVDELMNGIAAFRHELVVVLDDLQKVTDNESLSSIDYALDHLPAGMRLITITRVDPPLRLAQLRVSGRLAELRTDELAFTTAEARQLLERAGLSLQEEEVELLRDRTEGWPAALSLAALWLSSVDDPHRAVREFRGDQRFVADYLANEVIASLEDDARSFLLRASVLGRFTPELCDSVLDRSDSAAVLSELERANLFVVRLSHGGWYRVHSLFAEFAGFQLAARDAEAAPEIHRRAAEWLRAHGLPVEAAEHAAVAGDDELFADLLVEYHLAFIRSGGARTLLRWVRALPDEQVVEHPELSVAAATAATMIGGGALERRRLLQLTRRSQTEHPERFSPYVEAVEAMVRAASVEGGASRAVLEGRRAVEVAQAGGDAVTVAALAGYARALYFAGELEDAWKAALEAIEHPDADNRAPGQAFARSTLALAGVDLGRLIAARTHAEKARSLVDSVGSGRSWLGANASVAIGSVLAAEGNLAEAERELAYAEHFFRDEVATVHHAWLLVLLAGVRCRRGRVEEAEKTLQAAREAIAELTDSGRVPSLAADVERELEEATVRAESGEMLEAPSEAELAVLRLLTTDLSAREIGAELYLSANTVRSHTRALYRKLVVNSRADAVARADALGLLVENEIT
jgi:LuxR family transcriptional regulator, maltose regulon positive regulatory protein